MPRRKAKREDLSDFQVRALNLLLHSPCTAGQFSRRMEYKTSGDKWGTPALQGTVRLNRLLRYGFAYKDSNKVWHITELGCNRLLNYYGDLYDKQARTDWVLRKSYLLP